MRRNGVAVVLIVLLLGSLGTRAQAPVAQPAGEPKTTWYFYTVKWGFQDEFLDLFQRNHYPLLKARLKGFRHCFGQPPQVRRAFEEAMGIAAT